MNTTASALESVVSNKSQVPQKEDSADETFGKLLVDQLKLIPECDLKDELKITLQQIVLKCKRQVKAMSSAAQMEPPAVYAQRNPAFNSHSHPRSPQSPLLALSSPNSIYSGSYNGY